MIVEYLIEPGGHLKVAEHVEFTGIYKVRS